MRKILSLIFAVLISTSVQAQTITNELMGLGMPPALAAKIGPAIGDSGITAPGNYSLSAGSDAGEYLEIIAPASDGIIYFKSGGSNTQMRLDDAGNLRFNNTGDGVVFPAASVLTPVANSTPGAGSVISAVLSVVATAAPTSSYVHLPAATISVGKQFEVLNTGAHPLAIQPSAGNSINALAADTLFTCATGGHCKCRGATTGVWGCK